MKEHFQPAVLPLMLALSVGVAHCFEDGERTNRTGGFFTAPKEWKPSAGQADAAVQNKVGEKAAHSRKYERDYLNVLGMMSVSMCLNSPVWA